MKHLLLTIGLSLICIGLYGPAYTKLYIGKPPPMKDQTLLHAIIQVESGGNPHQINWKENAIGLLQIRPVMIEEVNRISLLTGRAERFQLEDAFDSLKSIQIYWIVQEYWNPTNDLRKGTLVWNGRGKTNTYWKKIQKHL